MAPEITTPIQRNPATDVYPITPNDSQDLSGGICRALIVEGAGTVVMITPGSRKEGTTRTIYLPSGLWPIQVHRILATGTTATNIVALY